MCLHRGILVPPQDFNDHRITEVGMKEGAVVCMGPAGGIILSLSVENVGGLLQIAIDAL